MSRWPEKTPDKPTKFEVVYKDEDGTESTWKYDLKKFPHGPISVENKYPAGYDKMMKKRMKEIKLEKKKSTIELAKEGKLNTSKNKFF